MPGYQLDIKGLFYGYHEKTDRISIKHLLQAGCPAIRENQGTREKSGKFTFWKTSGKSQGISA